MNPPLTRRAFALGSACLAGMAQATDRSPRIVSIVSAPSSLGLRPNEKGKEPGTWRAPEVLLDAGIADAVAARHVVKLRRQPYDFAEQPGTRIRNGNSLRAFLLELAGAVQAELAAGRFPLVLGGDCSVMLGCLYALRRAGGSGLVHVDGHSDFFHPGNYDTRSRLGTAAGMDLALATGRGEELLTQWRDVQGPLVLEDDAIQAGEREAEQSDWAQGYPDVQNTAITRLTIQQILRDGVPRTAARIIARLEERKLVRAWMHVDLDVLDERVMNAVDSPGTPGFDFAQLASLLGAVIASGRIAGMTVCIYDPDLDPKRRFPRPIVQCFADALRGQEGPTAASGKND
jgi:arginase